MNNRGEGIIIIGNSTAAIGAVEGVRSVDREVPLTVVSREGHHTYSRPLISYLLAAEIDRDLMAYRPADFYTRNSVKTRLGVEATSVDTKKRVVHTSDGEIPYDRLLIATGGRPIVPPIQGLGGKWPEGAFTFTAWDDADALDEFILRKAPRQAVVLGGGLIGIKAAEALHARGKQVTVVELARQLLPLALDEKAAQLALDAAMRAGVEVKCGTTIERVVAPRGRVTSVILKSRERIACNILVVAVGVAPGLDLVRGAPIECDRGILVDERSETSLSGVYAAGDVAQGADLLGGGKRVIPVLPGAYRQGWVAGVNMAGGQARTAGSLAMNAVGIFGLDTIAVGLANASGPGFEVLSRHEAGTRNYRRVVLRDGKIVGALYTGAVERFGILTGLIKSGLDVSRFKDSLTTDDIGLLSLPKEYRKHVVQGEGIEV